MQSLIDKLTDVDARAGSSSRRDAPLNIRDAVSRDLEDLLNTRSEGARTIPAVFEECRKSSLTFGLPDFSSYSLLSPRDRDRIRRTLELAIGLHEPRLTRVRVQLESQGTYNRALRFRIDALINLGPEREKVQFDAVLQLNTQSYQVH